MRAPPDSMKPTTGAPARPASRSTRTIVVGVRLAERAAEVRRRPARSRRPAGRRRGRRRRRRRRPRAPSRPCAWTTTSERRRVSEPASHSTSAARSGRQPLGRRPARGPSAVEGHAHAASKQSTALWPPNPNEFESAIGGRPFGLQRAGPRSGRSRGRALAPAPRSPASAGPCVSRSARMVATASTAPAAPSRCPIADLVEDTGISPAWSPSASLIAVVSARVVERRRGAVGVDVVDVLRRSMPASRSACAIASRRAAALGLRGGQVVGVGRSRRSRDLAEDRAPRAPCAFSASSSTSTPAPSPITKPSRRASNGREMPRRRQRVERGERGPGRAASAPPRSRR